MSLTIPKITGTERSCLPPGGSPAIDRAFGDRLTLICDQANDVWIARVMPGEMPTAGYAEPWRVMRHLYRWLIGWDWPESLGPVHSHRIRFVAVQWYWRAAELEEEIDRFIHEQRRANERD